MSRVATEIFSWLNAPDKDKIRAVVNFQNFARNPFMDALARIITGFGNEEFYVPFFIVVFWGPFCNIKLGWDQTLCIGLGYVTGNLLKNIWCVMRPLTHGEVWHYKGSSNEECEFGFPSTHALASVAWAEVFAINFWRSNPESQSVGMAIFWILFILCWSMSISLSRVYLGVHFFQDVVLGWTIGIVYGFVIAMASDLAHFPLISGSYVALAMVLIIGFGILHFHPISRTSLLHFHLSEGTLMSSAQMLGVAVGPTVSRFTNPEAQQYCSDDLNKTIVRLVLGIPMVYLIYLSKPIFSYALHKTFTTLKLKTKYVPHKEYKNYLATNIRSQMEAKLQSNNNANTDEQKEEQKDEMILVWVQLYQIFLRYTFLSVFVIHFPNWIHYLLY